MPPVFCRYGVSSTYLPYRGVHARPPNFAGTAFRAVTYLAGKIPRVHKGFAGMEFLAVTYQSDMTRSAEYCFTGMAFRAVTYQRISRQIGLRASQAPCIEQLHIGHEYGPSHSYTSQVPLFEQLLAQFQTQGISRAAPFTTVFMGGQLPVLKHLYFYTFAIWHHDSADCFSLTSSRRKLRSFAFIAFRACAPQKGRELIDALDGFAGTSFAAVRASASFFREKPSSRYLLRDHLGFVGHPLRQL